jgi:hypothetical protein
LTIMLAHGFTNALLDGLVRGGPATAERRAMRAGRKPVEVIWLTITDAAGARGMMGFCRLQFKSDASDAALQGGQGSDIRGGSLSVAGHPMRVMVMAMASTFASCCYTMETPPIYRPPLEPPPGGSTCWSAI